MSVFVFVAEFNFLARILALMTYQQPRDVTLCLPVLGLRGFSVLPALLLLALGLWIRREALGTRLNPCGTCNHGG